MPSRPTILNHPIALLVIAALVWAVVGLMVASGCKVYGLQTDRQRLIYPLPETRCV